MVRTWVLSVGFAVLGLLAAGCDSAKNAAAKVEEGAKKEAAQAKDLARRAEEEVKEAADIPSTKENRRVQQATVKDKAK